MKKYTTINLLERALNIDTWIDCDEVLEIAKQNGGKLEFKVEGKISYEPAHGDDAIRCYSLKVVE